MKLLRKVVQIHSAIPFSFSQTFTHGLHWKCICHVHQWLLHSYEYLGPSSYLTLGQHLGQVYSLKFFIYLTSRTPVSTYFSMLQSCLSQYPLLVFISHISKHWWDPGLASSWSVRESITPLLIPSKPMGFSSIYMQKTCKLFSAWTSLMISRLWIQLESSPSWSLETMPR